MCFGQKSKTPKSPTPPPPPQVLEQPAPEKKTANKQRGSTDLSIGTKKYRKDQTSTTASGGYPSTSQ